MPNLKRSDVNYFKQLLKIRTRTIKELKELTKSKDPELAHAKADQLLLDWIDDATIEKAYKEIKKWYA
jgi:hypothetical protein